MAMLNNQRVFLGVPNKLTSLFCHVFFGPNGSWIQVVHRIFRPHGDGRGMCPFCTHVFRIYTVKCIIFKKWQTNENQNKVELIIIVYTPQMFQQVVQVFE